MVDIPQHAIGHGDESRQHLLGGCDLVLFAIPCPSYAAASGDRPLPCQFARYTFTTHPGCAISQSTSRGHYPARSAWGRVAGPTQLHREKRISEPGHNLG